MGKITISIQNKDINARAPTLFQKINASVGV